MVFGGSRSDPATSEVGSISRHARHAAPLAPPTRCEAVDVRPTTRSTADRPGGASADHSARSRESALGLSTYRWRTEGSWRRRVGDHRQEDPASGAARPSWKAAGVYVA